MRSKADAAVRRGRFALDGRVAIITGATGGIGQAIARELDDAGAAIVLAHFDERDAARGLAAGLRSANAVHVDVRDPDTVRGLVESAVTEYGGIDILVNNAGTMNERPLEELDEDVWEQTLQVNLSGAYRCTRSALAALRSSGHGCVVNISSQIAYTGAPLCAAYAASKAGLLGLTRALARELAPAVRVNAVAPGPIESPMTAVYRTSEWEREKTSRLAMRRFGTPAEVAAAVRFLASDEASFFTGQTLSPNGGGAMP